jgi:ABC-type transport system substrate-binding protein
MANPMLGLSNYPDWTQFTVYQPLAYVNDSAWYNNDQIQYLPGLANWTVSANGMEYTFTLQPGVKFSNGDSLSAYNVWLAMYVNYYMQGNSTEFLSGYDVMYDDMATANFGPATIALFPSSSALNNPSAANLAMMEDSSWPIYVTGPSTIVFHLKAPFQYFPVITMPYGIPDMGWMIDHGGIGTITAPNTYFYLNSAPGTGPYMVTKAVQNSYVEFAKNPNYWGNSLTAAQIQANPLLDPGHVNNVIINYKSDDLTRYLDLKNGAAQIAAVEASNFAAVTANPSTFSYLTIPPWSILTFGIALNVNLYPTNNTDVRQAIVHAINYTDFIDKVMGGQGVQYVGPEFPVWKQFYDLGGYQPYSYNVTLAKQYLAEANIQNMPTLTIRTISDCEFCAVAAQVVQGYLSAIGIDATVSLVTGGTYFSTYGGYSTNVANNASLGQISFLGGETWSPYGLTPADNYLSWYSDNSGWGNWAGYYNPIVQACTESFVNGSSTAKTIALCTAAQKQIYNDAPYVTFAAGLWWIDGSIVWLKNGPIKSFYNDPLFNAQETCPIFNTVQFNS